MELKATAQMTRKKMSRPVFKYSFRKGRLFMASPKLPVTSSLGKMVGGTCMLSGTVLRLVRIIHTKGKIMIREPIISAA